jgi:hypothetical protein
MKSELFLLVLACTVCAQPQLVQCGPTSAAAEQPAPSGRASSFAAKAVVLPLFTEGALEPAGESAKPHPAVGNVAAQIRLRRPAAPGSSSCRCGTVLAGSLIARSNAQEVSILAGLAGSFRFDHVLIQEISRFSSDSVSELDWSGTSESRCRHRPASFLDERLLPG